MGALFKSLVIPILSLMLMALGFGLFMTFIAVRLDLEGVSTKMIGLASTCLNLGILGGALVSPRVAIRFGCSKALLMIYAAITGVILVHVFWVNATFWIILRLLTGVAIGSFFTVMESLFIKFSTPSTRSRSLSIYLICYYIGISCGQLLLNSADPSVSTFFYLSAAFTASAAIPIIFAKKDEPAPPEIEEETPQPKQPLHFGFLSAIAAGIIIASIYGLLPLYGKKISLSIRQISLLMSVIISGGFFLQWPIGKWGDCFGHRKTLRVVAVLAMLASLSIGFLHGIEFPWLLVLSWLFGASAFAFYPLSLAAICDKIEEKRVPKAVGKFVAAYSLGAIIGPFGTSISMDSFGPFGFFYFLSLICAITALIVFSWVKKGTIR